jgi:pyruvate dehydrogenase E1 component alpha subunit
LRFHLQSLQLLRFIYSMTIGRKRNASPAGSPPGHNGFSLISNDKLLQLYTTMLKCRMTEERIRDISRRNGAVDLQEAKNHEAAVVGVGLDLLPGDTLAPSPGGLILCFVKGLPLNRIFSALLPGSAGARPRYAPLKLISPSLGLGAQLNRALKAAAANKASKNKKIAVAFCGRSSGSAGVLQEAMRRAGKLNLPILLICHSDSGDEQICLKADECGFPGVTVDGDDAVAVYRVATEAVAHARRGSGPTLMECRPWALAGQGTGARRSAGNSILKMEKYLAGKGLFDRKLKSAVTASFRRELDAAIEAAGGKQS